MSVDHSDSLPQPQSAKPDFNEPITCPFTIIVDAREQAPFQFQTFNSDAKEHYRPLFVQTSVQTLKTGDYSILGFENEITIERKSLTDLYGTLGANRKRFIKELERMTEIRVSRVVVECSLGYALANPPARSKLSPKIVNRSIISWKQDYPTIHWEFYDSRSMAEMGVFRTLEMFWRKKVKKDPEGQ